MKALKKMICRIFGHDRGPWFRTVAGACSQHPFADGCQCYRCGRLLHAYNDASDVIPVTEDIQAPKPLDRDELEALEKTTWEPQQTVFGGEGGDH